MATPAPIRDDSADAPTDDRTCESTAIEEMEDSEQYDVEVIQYDDAPDECTIFPADAEESVLVTRWVSAQEGSYVALADCC